MHLATCSARFPARSVSKKVGCFGITCSPVQSQHTPATGHCCCRGGAALCTAGLQLTPELLLHACKQRLPDAVMPKVLHLRGPDGPLGELFKSFAALTISRLSLLDALQTNEAVFLQPTLVHLLENPPPGLVRHASTEPLRTHSPVRPQPRMASTQGSLRDACRRGPSGTLPLCHAHTRGTPRGHVCVCVRTTL
jgi:hypothetical protein